MFDEEDFESEIPDRPTLTLEATKSLARAWCEQVKLPLTIADLLGEVVWRTQLRDSAAILRQLRFRGVDVAVENPSIFDDFVLVVDREVRELGWLWVVEHEIDPPYPVGTLLRQGLIVGIDDMEPATYRVRPDSIPEGIPDVDEKGRTVRTTFRERSEVRELKRDPRIVLVRFEDADLLPEDTFMEA
jgi:hypothetical protein